MNHEITLAELSQDTAEELALPVQRFSAVCRMSKNQKGTFTPSHRRWDCDLYMDGEKILAVQYQCNMMKEPKALDVWHCVAGEAAETENVDLEDFIVDMAYTGSAGEIREGVKAYKSCRAEAKAMKSKGVSPHDVWMLLDKVEDSGLETDELVETKIVY